MSALGASSGSQGVVASQSVLCKKNPGFGLSVGFRVSVGFGFGMDFHPNRSSGWVRVSVLGVRHYTRTEPDPLPSLSILSINKLKAPFGHLYGC